MSNPQTEVKAQEKQKLQFPDFWRRMKENSKIVATFPEWMKGSRENIRK